MLIFICLADTSFRMLVFVKCRQLNGLLFSSLFRFIHSYVLCMCKYFVLYIILAYVKLTHNIYAVLFASYTHILFDYVFTLGLIITTQIYNWTFSCVLTMAYRVRLSMCELVLLLCSLTLAIVVTQTRKVFQTYARTLTHTQIFSRWKVVSS